MNNIKQSDVRTLYVLSKPIGGKPPRLIGELTENNGEYSFEYKLGGKLQEWFLAIEDFPDLTKKYTGKPVEEYIYHFIPRINDSMAKLSVKAAKLAEYDVWELLKFYGKRNMQEIGLLYKELPKDVIVYEA